jgi:hypothetical protein
MSRTRASRPTATGLLTLTAAATGVGPRPQRVRRRGARLEVSTTVEPGEEFISSGTECAATDYVQGSRADVVGADLARRAEQLRPAAGRGRPAARGRRYRAGHGALPAPEDRVAGRLGRCLHLASPPCRAATSDVGPVEVLHVREPCGDVNGRVPTDETHGAVGDGRRSGRG